MLGKFRLVPFAIIMSAVLTGAGFAQDQGFESLIEGVLKQHQDETQPQPPQLPPPVPGEQPAPGAQPVPGLPPPAAPVEPGVAVPPALVPVEPGPRPYTPPKIEHPAEEKPSNQATATTPGAANAPAASGAAAPATAAPGATPSADQNAATGAEQAGAPRTQESLTVEEVNGAVLPAELPPFNGASPLVLKAQVLLDRAGASPGVIDAYAGGNLEKAISAVETVLGASSRRRVEQVRVGCARW